MMASVVLLVSPESDVALPANLGRAAHAVFLDLLRQADPALAAALHDDDGAKPFTAAAPFEAALANRAVTACRAGAEYPLRFTLLTRAAAAAWLDHVAPALPPLLSLAGAPFRVVAARTADHPLAGQSSYAALAERYLLGRETPDGRVALAFQSPTTFRSQGRHVPLPLPELVFGSLLERWNAFAPVELSADLRRYAQECLAIARYDLRTKLVAAGEGRQVGFVGSCGYVALNRDPFWLRQIALLADYAFYSGVGHKTTMGLGQVRRLAEGGPHPPAPSPPAERGRRVDFGPQHPLSADGEGARG